MGDPRQLAPIDALVDLSRGVADAGPEPSAIVALLAAAAERHLEAEVVAVYGVGPDGAAALEAARGVDPAALAGHEPGFGVGLPAVLALPLASGGDLFGTLVVGWSDPPDPRADRLAAGLADIAAIGLERAHRNRELVETESLRRMGQMASMVAHEVKNPLASIGGVLQILRSRAREGSEDREILGKVLGRLTELDQLVDELLQFARPREPVLVPVAVDEIVREVVGAFVRDPVARDARVDLALEPARAVADRSMLERVLLNLLLNATHAMDGRGTIAVSVAANGSTVRIEVADQGPGIPPDLRERVFEPFFTTKARGTGLGLAVARQVVEAHRGTIRVVDSTAGARFAVELPSS